MIDFHSHIIPKIDDGARSEEETNSLLLEAKAVGFDKIISTSHYCKRQYEVEEQERKTQLERIEEDFKLKTNQDIKLILGSEVYITSSMVDLLNENKASTIDKTRYVLFELPLHHDVFNLKETIFKLMENKYKPIIAHPERYLRVQKNPNILIELIEIGVLFQSNYGSIIGVYGNAAKKTVKKLLKNNMVHFLGSDVHRENTIYPKIPKILPKIEKIVGKDRLLELTTLNAEKVLNNEDFDAYIPSKVKRFF